MMAPMLLACPSFNEDWEFFVEEWQEEIARSKDSSSESLPLYLALSELADHLIEKLENRDTENFGRIFQVVEEWVVNGSHYESEAAVVGLLEDLTAKHRYTKASPELFLQWLGPQSKKWWFEVIDFWDRLENDKFRPLSIE